MIDRATLFPFFLFSRYIPSYTPKTPKTPEKGQSRNRSGIKEYIYRYIIISMISLGFLRILYSQTPREKREESQNRSLSPLLGVFLSEAILPAGRILSPKRGHR